MDNQKTSFKSHDLKPTKSGNGSQTLPREDEKEITEEEVKMSYWLTVKDWAENSLCPGIPYIAKKDSYIWKFYWFALCAVGSYFTVSGIVTLMDIYQSYPVSVNINMTYSNKLPFPTVTVCNLNPVRASKISDIPTEYATIFAKIYENTSLGRGTDRLDSVNKFLQVYNLMPNSVRMKIGHRKNDTILDCIYNGEECTASDFVEWIDPVYGVCFTFNIGLDEVTFEHTPMLYAYRTGPSYGLSVELFLDQDEYIEELNDMAGIKVLIGTRGRMPFPADEGIYLSPGTHTSISVRMVTIKRKPDPYMSKCITVNGETAKAIDVYSEAFNMDYHVTSCLKTCYQSYVLSECGCGDPKIPINYQSTKSLLSNTTAHYSPCATPETLNCQLNVNAKFGNDEFTCSQCGLPCLDRSFSYTTSVATWPSARYVASKISQLETVNPDFAAETAGSSVPPQQNVLRFNAHFSELNTEVIYETATYSFETLMSNLGGYLGLYLGLSFIAIFELLQFLGDLMCVALRKLWNIKKKPSLVNAW